MTFCILFSLREIWREKSLNVGGIGSAGDRTISRESPRAAGELTGMSSNICLITKCYS